MEKKQTEQTYLTEKLRKLTKKQKCVLGLSQMLGINIISAHCDSNAPCTSFLCFGGACWGYSCDHLACSSQQSGDCKNRQCSDSACKSGAGYGPKCDKTQCSENSCTEYACLSQSCVNNTEGLCASQICKSEEIGDPRMTAGNGTNTENIAYKKNKPQ